jgi:hypothetical protein
VDSERFIRGLAAALPEAFAGLDLEEEFCTDRGAPEQRWLAYVALPVARSWVQEKAIRINPLRRVARVRRGGEEALRRYFAFFEPLAADPDPGMQNLLMIELFEGVVWVEDVIEYVGPNTRALLTRARTELSAVNSAIGRWSD